MRRSLLPQRRWVRMALIFGIATFIGLFQASQGAFLWALEGREVPWLSMLARGLSDWYVWALWTPLVFWLAGRLPIEGRFLRHHLTVHGAMSVLLSVLTLLLVLPVFLWTQLPTKLELSSDDVLRLLFTAHFIFYVWIYWAIVALSHAIGYYGKYQERELRASQLEARLAQARLQVLKMQLHPHFLFNTLNAISALIHQDVDLADKMIAQLGRLLRLSLESGSGQEVPLRQELDFVHAYLEIEQARLGPRLKVVARIDADTMEARVPNLILQPLVENAIRHGIAPRAQGGTLTMRSRRICDYLVIEVEDDGPGLPAEGPAHHGIGLANTRRRLRELYGDQHRFVLERGAAGGLCVRLELPCQSAVLPPSEVNILDSATYPADAVSAYLTAP